MVLNPFELQTRGKRFSDEAGQSTSKVGEPHYLACTAPFISYPRFTNEKTEHREVRTLNPGSYN